MKKSKQMHVINKFLKKNMKVFRTTFTTDMLYEFITLQRNAQYSRREIYSFACVGVTHFNL